MSGHEAEMAATVVAAFEASTTPEVHPSAEKPAVEEPVAETPVAETPIAETPIAETPVAKAPVANAPVAQTEVPALRGSKKIALGARVVYWHDPDSETGRTSTEQQTQDEILTYYGMESLGGDKRKEMLDALYHGTCQTL